MSESCEGCKFLYGDGDGYSDWTWMYTNYTCALNLNPNLPREVVYDKELGELPEIKNGRCKKYSEGPYIEISPDGNPGPDFVDPEQEAAIRADRYVEGNE